MPGDSERPRRVEALGGVVESGSLGKGSKSERDAFWIQTPDARLVLRRKDGPSYGDRALAAYVNKRVSCDGFITGYL